MLLLSYFSYFKGKIIIAFIYVINHASSVSAISIQKTNYPINNETFMMPCSSTTSAAVEICVCTMAKIVC